MKAITPARLTVAVTLLFALCVAPAAQADEFRRAKFNIEFTAKRTTSWEIPKHDNGGSCFQRFTYSASGDETWDVKSKGTAKAIALQHKKSKNVHVIFAGWSDKEAIKNDFSIPVAMITNRTAFESDRWDPGPCGGTGGLNPPHTTDCGSKLPRTGLGLSWFKGKVTPSVSIPTEYHYDDCLFHVPIELTNPVSLPEIPGKLTARQLFSNQKTLTATGKNRYLQVPPDDRPNDVRATMDAEWKLTLKRVK